MYSGLLLLAALVLPIPALIKGLKKRERPYLVCLAGIISAGVGMVLLFILSTASGHPIEGELLAAGDQMAAMLSPEDAEKALALYRMATEAIPGTMLILAATLSYVEYILLSRIVKVEGAPADRMPPFREFSLPRNAITGWFVIFVLSWIVKQGGAAFGQVAFLNINLLFEFTFSLQGISIILLWSHLRGIPKAVPVLMVLFLWFVPMGKMVLFLAGILDLFFGLRRRMAPR